MNISGDVWLQCGIVSVPRYPKDKTSTYNIHLTLNAHFITVLLPTKIYKTERCSVSL